MTSKDLHTKQPHRKSEVTALFRYHCFDISLFQTPPAFSGGDFHLSNTCFSQPLCHVVIETGRYFFK
jgi:hypothetical protein